MSTGTKYRLDSLECPTCGRDDFDSETAVRMHHTKKHNQKLPNLVCENCGDLFHYKSRRAKCDSCIQEEKDALKERKPVECVVDDCGQRFKSKSGMKTHHYYKHDESIAKYPNQNNSVGECDNEEWREPCPVCGDEFINMGQHWDSTQCEYPKLSKRQKDMLRGILMSDGSIQFGENNNVKITLVKNEFLKWFSDELDCICPNRYPTVYQTPEESKRGAIKSLGKEAVDMDSEYKTKYLLLTRSHPFINEFDDWYTSDQKRYPLDELDLTPPMAKMWYCGDGSLDTHRSQGWAEIACANESDRLDDVADLIRDKGFDVYVKSESIQLTSSDTPDFLDWMGEAPPGFEYKWL